MKKKQIRVGIIGTSSWAQYGHIPALQSSEDFSVLALAGRSIDKVKKCAAQFGIPCAYDSPAALLEHWDIDLDIFLAPTPEHGRLTKLAINAGKDVYCFVNALIWASVSLS